MTLWLTFGLSVLSSLIVACANHWFTLKRLNKQLESDRKARDDQHNKNIMLEWHKYMLELRIENIDILYNCLIEEHRYTWKVYKIYKGYFEQCIEEGEYLADEWNNINSKINSFEYGSDRTIRKSMNKGLNFFPSLKAKYNNERILKKSLYLSMLWPKETIEKLINKGLSINELQNELKNYEYVFEDYQQDCFNLIDELLNTHRKLVTDVEAEL
ncbi:hypothetical protein [Staphylococcus simulans]|uniref:hypothetical protein n=1 Tax=Staphylococcus simulans TaxID=1286 RepID=UPI000D1D91D4|nr:hypothetical protein [Staphylococcus simulans]PTJ89794.1 hypothetical protein BU032_11955 [Staphylococcus simulans]